MTNIDTVRLLIADTATAEADRLLTDEQLQSLLALEGDHVKLAAAQALDTIASSEALVAKAIRTRDLSTDGAKTAAALRAHAAALRSQAAQAADEGDDAGHFEVVDMMGPDVARWP